MPRHPWHAFIPVFAAVRVIRVPIANASYSAPIACWIEARLNLPSHTGDRSSAISRLPERAASFIGASSGNSASPAGENERANGLRLHNRAEDLARVSEP